jgi:hypothetical protein
MLLRTGILINCKRGLSAPDDRSGQESSSDSWLTITTPPPMFFISVDSKEVNVPVSRLDATLARRRASVASKGFVRGRKEKQ